MVLKFKKTTVKILIISAITKEYIPVFNKHNKDMLRSFTITPIKEIVIAFLAKPLACNTEYKTLSK